MCDLSLFVIVFNILSHGNDTPRHAGSFTFTMKSLTWLVLTWRDENGVVGSSSHRGGFGKFVGETSAVSVHFVPLSTCPNKVMLQDENNKE